MKTIVFVALLAAAGCSKKTSDCDASIGKGLDNFAASVQTSAPNPEMQETRLKIISKLRGTFTQRCNEDQWPAEVVSCFTTVASMKDMQSCQAKLSNEQRTKLVNEVRQVMMGAAGSMRMPSGVPGHPPMLTPGSGAPEASGALPGAPAGAAAPPVGAAGSPAGSAAPPAGSVQAPASPAPPATAGSAAPSRAAGSNGW